MSWSDVRGHDGPREQLQSAYRLGRLAHAYLFVGPEGVGKRLFAAEFAKSLLCERPPEPLAACDICRACKQVSAGSHPDFFRATREADKNDLTVEAVRAFVHKLGLRASRGSRKVGLVEEADEFNTPAANAFLKPLEEPPPGTTLVLLATSADRQLPTILSRCQLVQFRPLGRADFDAVLAGQGVAEPARQDRLFRLSGGSPGRALALNDPSLWEFRETLLKHTTAERPDAVGLASKWIAFAEEAGKQVPAQRERARLALALFLDVLRDALRLSLSDGAPADAEGKALHAWGRNVGADEIADRLDACLAAEGQIERYVQLGLVLETLAGRVARPA